ncbi:hypothetical protein [Streptomyces collinus]|uniref:hypothetical protein n=1 Tax=Streptomyces collinus TaxID=42684 RepID=UPI00294330C7|nr:hypothetical protein [Streptomyces collinus]
MAVPGASATVSSSSQASHGVSAKASRWHCTGKWPRGYGGLIYDILGDRRAVGLAVRPAGPDEEH